MSRLRGEDATHLRRKGRTSSNKGDVGCLRKRQQKTGEEEVTSEKEKVTLSRRRKLDVRGGRGSQTSEDEGV